MRITAKLAVPSTGGICDHPLTPLTGGFTMPLQDLRPINDQLADIIVVRKTVIICPGVPVLEKSHAAHR